MFKRLATDELLLRYVGTSQCIQYVQMALFTFNSGHLQQQYLAR